MRRQLTAAAALVLAYALYGALDLVARPVYPVPEPGSVVLITGARRGIGFSAAKRLAREGFFVIAAARTEKDVAAIEALKIKNIDGFKLDMKSEQDMINVEKHIRDICAKHKKKFAGVVHNAVTASFGFIELGDVQEVRDTFEVAVFSVGLLTQKLLPLLREHHGRVLAIGSISSFLPMPSGSPYSEAKAALNMFMDTLRLEVLPHQVAVINLITGMVASEVLTDGELVASLKKAAELPGMKEHYPGFYAKKEAIFAQITDAVNMAPLTTAWGSTDDSVFSALTAPRPPLNLTPGLFAGFLRFLHAALPDAVFFRLATLV